jgi:predicted NUDIX family phosphoesterase
MEFVYVVPRGKIFPEFYPQGLVRFDAELTRDAVMDSIHQNGFFVEREYAERTPSLKQVIPYTVVVSEGKVMLTKRLPQGGEGRLFGKLSIGIGGHMNPVDHTGDAESATPQSKDPIAECTLRELEEELWLEGARRLEPIGIINDDSNPVGAVHIGLVQVLFLHKGSARVREEDILEGRMVAPDELASLLADGANFETWSRMLVERLGELLPLPQPAHT